MPQIWQEPYSLEKARELRILDLEGGAIVRWDERGSCPDWSPRAHEGAAPEWIYYVSVCGFTFAFFSLPMMRAYLSHYEQKVLPTRIRNTPHCNHDRRQDVFTRLPLYLREESKRRRVVRALSRALSQFES